MKQSFLWELELSFWYSLRSTAPSPALWRAYDTKVRNACYHRNKAVALEEGRRPSFYRFHRFLY